MSGRIPRQFIDDLLVRVDIVDLIDSHVPLKKTGSNFVARCPFHTEKTPSFSVNRNRQIYHCFGCGASGNAISFLMDFSHLGFVEAVEDLAAFAGVEVPREFRLSDATQSRNLTSVYEVLEKVAGFYVEQLCKSPEAGRAVEYLRARGISDDVARTFMLGYAPDRWDALLGRLPREALIEAGMLVVKDDGKAYDRFRGRLMFPIRDKRKRVIGFGGRVLDDSLPKYLNSPETSVFSKGRELYGLCELLSENGKPERILVVEGYMDVIALTQFGVVNSVAALGTALSKAHVDLLFRYTSELVFCFDGDNAGRQAAWKGVEAALPCLRDGRRIKIMLLPQGHDPDSLIRAENLSKFMERIATARVLSDYLFENVADGLDLATVEGRSGLASKAKPLIDKVQPGFFKDMMLARLYQLSAVELVENAATLKTSMPNSVRRSGGKQMSLARKVIALLLQYPNVAKAAEIPDESLNGLDFPGAELLRDLLTTIALEKPGSSAILIERYRNTDQEKIVGALGVVDLGLPEGGEVAEFEGALHQLVKQGRTLLLNRLIEKEAREGLSDAEREQLRGLLREG
ncbi:MULTISPECIES: DNA primase [Methylomonas]|uniref:DNA primase n=1 Tax=Methylomonas koyamae TaxID=702114 RepID=A0A177N1Z9_9GAMM|nr:DNA primase [Methylomonas koyamae]NJA07850.1 DNA primase [Methylococcaceae bacterium WWC4]OAI11563.1 DNA primase [Methylomonas koyamae]